MVHRYAVYAVPPAGSPVLALAEAWLGRSARTGEAVPRGAALAAREGEIDAVVTSPRRYGFHGTLRAPMRLADGARAGDLSAAVRAVAARTAPFALTMRVGDLSGFLALLPAGEAAPVAALHAAVLRATEPFRAPPDAAELARRRAAPLSAAEEALLERWGYPYVLERFRFHMTLTERLDPAAKARIGPLLEETFADALAAPVPLELAVFAEPEPGAAFREVERHPLCAPPGAPDREDETR